MQLNEIGYKFDTNGRNRLQIQNLKVTNGRNSLQIAKKEMDEIGYKPTKFDLRTDKGKDKDKEKNIP